SGDGRKLRPRGSAPRISHPRGQGAWQYQARRLPMVTVAPGALLSCAVPPLSRRMQSPAAWSLLLQKSIAMASDYAAGFCTWQSLLQRHGLHHCANSRLHNARGSVDTTVPHEHLGRVHKVCYGMFAVTYRESPAISEGWLGRGSTMCRVAHGTRCRGGGHG